MAILPTKFRRSMYTILVFLLCITTIHLVPAGRALSGTSGTPISSATCPFIDQPLYARQVCSNRMPHAYFSLSLSLSLSHTHTYLFIYLFLAVDWCLIVTTLQQLDGWSTYIAGSNGGRIFEGSQSDQCTSRPLGPWNRYLRLSLEQYGSGSRGCKNYFGATLESASMLINCLVSNKTLSLRGGREEYHLSLFLLFGK